MLNLKRGLLFLGVLLGLFILVISSIYTFFNVNDYSDWISEQVKKSTGYDVRFEKIEANWSEGKRLSLLGLSIYQQQQQIAFIKRVDLQIDHLDLWQRELELKSIILNGVDINILTPLKLSKTDSEIEIVAGSQNQKTISELTTIDWERLHIATFEITHLNAVLRHEDKNLSLKQASLTFNDLLLINNQQLQSFPAHLDISSAFETLLLSDDRQTVEINDFNLIVTAGLVQRKVEFIVTAAEIKTNNEAFPAVMLDSIELRLKFEKNKLFLQRFFVNTFSGSLEMTAEALLQINFFPKAAISIKKVALLSLNAQDMSINIPQWQASNNDSQPAPVNISLPVEELSIQKANLKNISINGETQQLPWHLKSADVEINNWLVIKDIQLLDPTQDIQKTGSIAIAFKYLRWQDSIIEQFSMDGSLSKRNDDLILLNQLLSK